MQVMLCSICHRPDTRLAQMFQGNILSSHRKTLQGMDHVQVTLSGDAVEPVLTVSDSLKFLAIRQACIKFLEDELSVASVIDIFLL